MPSTTARTEQETPEKPPRFSALSSRIPQLLYYAVIATIPFYRFRQLSATNPLLKVDWLLVMALLAIVLPLLFLQKSTPRSLRSNLWPWFGLFLTINLVSSLLSPYPNAAAAGLVLLLLDFVFIAINLIMIDRRGFRRIMPLVLLASVTLNAALAAAGYFLNVDYFRMGERGIGGTIGANNAALMGVFVIPLVMYWVWHAHKPLLKNLALAALAVNILGIVSSESRAGFLNMTLILGLSLYSERSRFHPRYLGLVMAGLGLVALIAIVAVPERYIERQATLMEGTQADLSTRRRAAYLDVGLRSFLHNPVLGTGTQTFSRVWVQSKESLRFQREERGAHNTYVEVLVGSGLLGFLFFALLLLQAFQNYSKAVHLYQEAEDQDSSSLAKAYRLSFLSVVIYFLFKSGLDHKMFLLALPLSQTALMVARQETRAVLRK